MSTIINNLFYSATQQLSIVCSSLNNYYQTISLPLDNMNFPIHVNEFRFEFSNFSISGDAYGRLLVPSSYNFKFRLYKLNSQLEKTYLAFGQFNVDEHDLIATDFDIQEGEELKLEISSERYIYRDIIENGQFCRYQVDSSSWYLNCFYNYGCLFSPVTRSRSSQRAAAIMSLFNVRNSLPDVASS